MQGPGKSTCHLQLEMLLRVCILPDGVVARTIRFFQHCFTRSVIEPLHQPGRGDQGAAGSDRPYQVRCQRRSRCHRFRRLEEAHQGVADRQLVRHATDPLHAHVRRLSQLDTGVAWHMQDCVWPNEQVMSGKHRA